MIEQLSSKQNLLSEADANDALLSVNATLNVLADYVHIRAHHKSETLYASDDDLADALFTAAEQLSRVHASLAEAGRIRALRTVSADQREGVQ